MKKLCLIICIGFTAILIANSQEIDSLKNIDHSNLHDSVRFNIYMELANKISNEDTVIKYSYTALEMANSWKPIKSFWPLIMLGQAYKIKGDHEKSLGFLLRASTIADKLTLSDKGMSFAQLGSLYIHSKDLKKAIPYFKSAIDYYSKSNSRRDSFFISSAYNNLAEGFNGSDQLDSALFYYNKALNFSKALSYDYQIALITGNIGIVNAKLGNYQLAEEQILQSFEYLKSREILYPISVFLIYLSDIYIEKKEYIKAHEYLQQSLEIAQQIGLKEQVRDAYKRLYEFEKARQNFKESLVYYEQFVSIRDSIINTESIKNMAELRTEYAVGQKQIEVDLLTAQKRTRNIIAYSLSGFLLIAAIFGTFYYKNYKAKSKLNQVLELQKNELENLNNTKDKFFSIISHDIRGPVSAFHGISRMIKYLVTSKKTDELIPLAGEIDKSVDGLSGLLDNLLGWATQQQGQIPNIPEKVDFNEIVDELVKTFDNMAQSKNIEFKSTVEGKIFLWADKNSTSTIFRNLVNNALKFTPEGGLVIMSGEIINRKVIIKVSDTGVGIHANKIDKLFQLQVKKSTYGTSGEKGLGLGLQLVADFVAMNKGEIQVESEEGKGTTFTVLMPLFDSETVVL